MTSSTTMRADWGGHDQPAETYALDSSPAEQHRLLQQLALLRAHSTALLDRVDLRPGGNALDLGCGPAGILDLLSARTGPSGQVTGVDNDGGHAAAARAFAHEHAQPQMKLHANSSYRGNAIGCEHHHRKGSLLRGPRL